MTKKPKIIRPGQRKPFKKCTQEQVEERIEFTAGLLAILTPHHEIKKKLKKRYKLEYRQVAEYITRAKRFLQKQANMTRSEARELGIGVILANIKEGKPSERTLAEKRLGEIFGYNAPRMLTLGGMDGAPPIPVSIKKYDPRKLDTEKLKKLKSILQDAKVQTEAGA